MDNFKEKHMKSLNNLKNKRNKLRQELDLVEYQIEINSYQEPEKPYKETKALKPMYIIGGIMVLGVIYSLLKNRSIIATTRGQIGFNK
jgi:hypothetical protein